MGALSKASPEATVFGNGRPHLNHIPWREFKCCNYYRKPWWMES